MQGLLIITIYISFIYYKIILKISFAPRWGRFLFSFLGAMAPSAPQFMRPYNSDHIMGNDRVYINTFKFPTKLALPFWM